MSSTDENPKRDIATLGWRSRGYLPHRDAPGLTQSVTFRLWDSLPQSRLRQLEAELSTVPVTDRDALKRSRIEAWLDAGYGCCALRHPSVALRVVEALLDSDNIRYRLLAWCVMPNHVHVLVVQSAPLSQIVRCWKSYTGRWALAHNAQLELGIPGKRFWMREYWDRYMRDEYNLQQTIDYIHSNPVKAGLCTGISDWRWSSACGSAGLLPGRIEPAGREPGAPNFTSDP